MLAQWSLDPGYASRQLPPTSPLVDLSGTQLKIAMDTRYEGYGVKKKETGEKLKLDSRIVHVKPASPSIIEFRGARVTSPMVSRELEVGPELARGGVRTYQNSDMSCIRAGFM